MPIARHPDVRRNLLTMRALSESARVLCYEVAKLLDIASCGHDAAERERSAQLAAFLLPVCKAGCGETAVAVTDLAIQVHGGHGYIRDNGVERLYRDARILPIYEGTTGIQAIDLVCRKLSAGGGFTEFRRRVRADIEHAAVAGVPRAFTETIVDAVRVCECCADHLRQHLVGDRDRALAAATPFLHLVYKLALGWAWLLMLTHSRRDRQALLVGASFFAQDILPEIDLLQKRVRSDPSSWIERSGPSHSNQVAVSSA